MCWSYLAQLVPIYFLILFYTEVALFFIYDHIFCFACLNNSCYSQCLVFFQDIINQFGILYCCCRLWFYSNRLCALLFLNCFVRQKPQSALLTILQVSNVFNLITGLLLLLLPFHLQCLLIHLIQYKVGLGSICRLLFSKSNQLVALLTLRVCYATFGKPCNRSLLNHKNTRSPFYLLFEFDSFLFI